MAKEAAQRLADDGRIVSILTVVTVIGSANFSAYVGGKAAIEGFNICLNKELGERGITVNTV